MTTNTLIPTLDAASQIPAYVVAPRGTPRGTIIVIQEIFGVNPGIMRKAEDWAAAGYLAVAPDVFWRQQPGVEFNPDDAGEFQQAIALMMKHDFALGLDDLKAVIAWIRKQEFGKIGLVGFCMGGKITYQAAAHADIEASVGYYGVGIDQILADANSITGQLLLHIPTADGFVPAAAQAAMHEVLDGNAHVTLYDYEGLDHGFADTFGARRNEAGAQPADDRTAAFFGKYVG